MLEDIIPGKQDWGKGGSETGKEGRRKGERGETEGWGIVKQATASQENV